MASTELKCMFKHLRDLGIPTPYVRQKLLPSWWDESIADKPSGLAETAMLLSRRTGQSIQALLGLVKDPCEDHTSRQIEVRFKGRGGLSAADYSVASMIGVEAAHVVAEGVEAEFEALGTADEIRSEILDSGAPCVGFEQLVEFCWNKGIPVLHFSELPAGRKKPAAMVVSTPSRPVVILCSGKTHPSWLLFHLAHELGHISLGHLEPGGMILDERVDQQSSDQDEKAADEFGLDLISGVGVRFIAHRIRSADWLVRFAREKSLQHQVDPGHIVLSCVHSLDGGFWGLGNAALSKMPTKKSPRAIVSSELFERLDWDQLPEPECEFLAKMVSAKIA